MEEVRFEQLRAAYDTAFEELVSEVRALELAELRVRHAETAYREKRDELAEFILTRQKEELEEVARA